MITVITATCIVVAIHMPDRLHLLYCGILLDTFTAKWLHDFQVGLSNHTPNVVAHHTPNAVAPAVKLPRV